MNVNESNKDTNSSEFYEEMEKGNQNENLTDKKHVKKMVKKKKIIYFIIITFIIVILVFLIYLLINKKKSYNITIKQYLSLTYNENNSIRNRKAHEEFRINSVSFFPSGNLIAYDYNMMIIYDNLFNKLQEIYAFDEEFNLIKDFKDQKVIISIEIINENYFILIINNGNLNLYKKENGIFNFKKEIIKNENISRITLDSNGNIYSLSNDSIKIFEKIDYENYIIKKKIIIPNMNSRNIYSYNNADNILLLEDKNILILKQTNSIRFFDISKNYSIIYKFEEKRINSIERFGEDKLIALCNSNNLKVISIYENKVFNNIKTEIESNLVKYNKAKDLIILGTTDEINRGVYWSKIKFLRSDNFDVIKIIENNENNFLNGIFILKDDIIGASFYKGIKMWKLIIN